jgi:hypothetical protein
MEDSLSKTTLRPSPSYGLLIDVWRPASVPGIGDLCAAIEHEGGNITGVEALKTVREGALWRFAVEARNEEGMRKTPEALTGKHRQMNSRGRFQPILPRERTSKNKAFNETA